MGGRGEDHARHKGDVGETIYVDHGLDPRKERLWGNEIQNGSGREVTSGWQ